VTFDQGQTPRLGQTLPPEQPGIQVLEQVTLPEVAFPGQVVYLTDTGQFAVFWDGAWQMPNTGPDPIQTFVSPTEPLADQVGDLWLNNISFQLSVWNGTAWVLALDPENTLKKYQAAQSFYSVIASTAATSFAVYATTSAPASPIQNDYWYNPQTNAVQRRGASAWLATTTGNAIAIRNLATTSSVSIDGLVRFYKQGTTPTGLSASNEGDVWFDTSNAILYRWNGGAWVTVADGLAMGSGALGNDQVTTTQLKADAITAKHTLTGPTIQTTVTASRGIKLTSGGLVAYDSGGATTFTLDASTGAVTMTGSLTSGSTVSGAIISGGTVIGATVATATSGERAVMTPVAAFGGSTAGALLLYDGPGNNVGYIIGLPSNGGMQIGNGGVAIRFGIPTASADVFGNMTVTGAFTANGGITSNSNAVINGQLTTNGGGVVAAGGAVLLTTGGHVLAQGNIHTDAGEISTGGVITGGAFVRAFDGGVWNTTLASNMHVELPANGGRIQRVTSDRSAKLDIADITLARAKKILDVPARTWVDRQYAEIAADYLDKKAKGEKGEDGEELKEPYYTLKRIPGVVADEIEAVGLSELVHRDETDPDSLASVSYDRIATYLIPIIKDQQDRIEKLEKRLATLEKTKAAGTK